MNMVLIVCALGFGEPTARDALVQRLEAEYQEALKSEKSPAHVRQAAELLREIDPNSWKFRRVCALLRASRSKAAVPLLMRYMVEHAGFPSSRPILEAYADTVTHITGKNIGKIYEYGEDRQGECSRRT